MSRLIERKYRAGVLPFVLGISIIMVAISSAGILLFYYHLVFTKSQQAENKLYTNVHSAVQIGLHRFNSLPENQNQHIDLFNTGNDSVSLQRFQWGLYQGLHARAYRGKSIVSKSALIGTKLLEDKAALFLADRNKALVLSGQAKIVGDAYLPKAGIRAGEVQQVVYSHSQLVFGDQKETGNVLPPHNEAVRNYLNGLQVLPAGAIEQGLPDSLQHGFGGEPLIFSQQGPLVLYQHLKGCIIIRSDHSLIVEASASLEQVILVAPYIHIKRGFKGTLQAFARDSLLLEQQAELGYPSAAVVLNGPKDAWLSLQEGAVVSGVVALLHEEGISEQYGICSIMEGSRVLGEVYSDAYVQHRGLIRGRLVCNKLYLKTPGSIYENYLYQGIIDWPAVPDIFLFSSLHSYASPKGIIRWL